MSINEILTENGMTKYRLAKLSGVPHATLNDICSGKTRIEKCSGETLYKLAKVLSVSMETLMESAMAEQIAESSIERSYEYGLPVYLHMIVSSGILCPPASTLALTLSIASSGELSQK